jgi:membrane-associated phospholipid phosphatase
MMFLTDFADQAVVLPIGAGVLLFLLGSGWLRGAAAWLIGVGGVLLVMLAAKMLAMACQRHLEGLGLSSPSGHTASAAVVYGGLVALLARHGRTGEWLTIAASVACAAVIGATRLALHMHTLEDVLVGLPIGMAGAVAIRHIAGARPKRLRQQWLIAIAIAVLLIFHGRKLQAEQPIRWLALDMWPLDRCR